MQKIKFKFVPLVSLDTKLVSWDREQDSQWDQD